MKDEVYLGDCLEVMRQIPDDSVDMVLCDLPYGVLNKQNEGAKWDSVIPFQPLWEHYERVAKANAAIVLFAQGMFTARLMMSNPKLWRYNLVWKKGNRTSGFLNANRMPLRNHEDICVFYKKLPTYNPQMEWGEQNHHRGAQSTKTNQCYGKFEAQPATFTNWKFPKSVITFERDYDRIFHNTQKPVSLMRYLIRTYTNEGDTVLDNCMGSGTTCVAAIKEKRHYIGIEKEKKYFEIAQKRINEAKQQLTLF